MELQQITCYLPPWLGEAVSVIAPLNPEELRLRAGHRPMALYGGKEQEIFPRRITSKELEDILMAAANHSCHAASDKISEGYLTVRGGHRIGICGTAVMRDGRVVHLKNISSLCIRIAAEHPNGFDLDKIPLTASALIIGRAGSGKTTFLRAAIKRLSQNGERVGVADCRSEIAAVYEGVAQFALGAHTDVLSGVKTAEGLMMLLRTMRPEWLCCDEITAEEDIRAIELCSCCGANILATAHAACVQDLYKRPLYRRLMEKNIFENVIVIGSDRTVRTERVEACGCLRLC